MLAVIKNVNIVSHLIAYTSAYFKYPRRVYLLQDFIHYFKFCIYMYYFQFFLWGEK